MMRRHNSQSAFWTLVHVSLKCSVYHSHSDFLSKCMYKFNEMDKYWMFKVT